MTIYMVMGICDDEYGCTEVLGVFNTKEKAEMEKAKLVKEAIKDEIVDEKGKKIKSRKALFFCSGQRLLNK